MAKKIIEKNQLIKKQRVKIHLFIMNIKRILKHTNSVIENPILYKYYNEEAVIKALNHSSLQFTHPSLFNDPFDCNTALFGLKEDDVKEYFKEVIKKHYRTDYLTRYRLQRNYKKRIEPEAKKYMQNIFDFENANRGISCFSKTPKNLLMWAHYANNHKGVCIGYDTKKLRNTMVEHQAESAFFEIKYVDKIQPKNFLKDRTTAIDYWLTTKHKAWEYEQEVRLISRGFANFEDKKHLFKIPPDSIKEIVFGFATPIETKEKIKHICKNKPLNVVIHKVEPNYSSFLLDIREIKSFFCDNSSIFIE